MTKNFLQLIAAAVLLALVLWIIWAHHTPAVPVTRILVTSGSMEPTLHIGQEYPCMPPALAPFANIKAGDILEADRPAISTFPVAHRATRKTLYGWKTKGDANAREDGDFVSPINYRGTVKP